MPAAEMLKAEGNPAFGFEHSETLAFPHAKTSKQIVIYDQRQFVWGTI
jgi:hypothetical protein